MTLAPDFKPKGAPMREEISAVLLHQPAESQRLLKQTLEGRSIKVSWVQNYQEALPLLREADESLSDESPEPATPNRISLRVFSCFAADLKAFLI